MSTEETMSVVEHSFYDAVLADIVYVNIDGEVTGKSGFTKGLHGEDLAKLIAPELTKPLADQIGDRFIVLDVKNDPISGYQGVLFKDLVSGDVILANRGTAGWTDIDEDVDLALLSGVARNEIITMVNWWNDISRPQGTAYTALTNNLGAFSSAGTQIASGADVDVIATAIAQNKFRVVGHSLGGHLTTVFASLFHDQVSASSTFNGAGIDSIGIYATGALNQLMKDFLVGKPLDQLADILGVTAVLPQNSQNNYYAENGFSLTTSDWIFSQIGKHIGLENEQSNVAFWQNHSMYKLTDLLALYATLAKLQPDIDIQTLNGLAKASSNESVNSLENMLDSVRRFFSGESITLTPVVDSGGDWEDNTMPPERIAFHTNLQNLGDQISSLETLLGKVRLTLPSSDSESLARNDFSVFLSLLTLSPVVIRGNDAMSQADLDALLKTAWEPEYQQWHDDINKPDTQRTFTDTYLQDRAKMLSYIIQANQQNILPSAEGSLAVTSYELGKSEAWQLSDLATHKQLSVTVNNGSYQNEYDNGQLRDHFAITFGSQSDDSLNGSAGVDHIYGDAGSDVIYGNASNDYLEGNVGNDELHGGDNDDILIGGAGDDTLNGDAGNDYLEGGLGIDTYRIVSGEDTDTILDADGFGYIQWDDLILSGSSGLAADKWKHPGDGVWQDLTNNISYILSLQADGKNQLIIFKGSEKLIVNGWKEGDLNISGLAGNTDAADIPDTSVNSTTSRTILGDPNPIDDDPNTAGIQYRYDALGNVIGNGQLPGRDDILYGSAGNDAINGLGGNDEIHATQGGNDVIDGGTGNDFIYAGTGQNKIYGGDGSDAIVGGYSKDIIFGDTEVTDIAAYISASRSAASVDAKGDFLAGHSGDDVLISGAKNDTIEGGDGADLIVSGAGNDFIDADGNNFVNNFNYSWTFQDTSTDSKPWDTYLLSESYAFLPDGSGDDTVYAGAGNDVAWLGKGNDKAYGGDGNDELYGDEGNDVLFGENGDDTLRGDSYWNNDTEHGSDYLDGGDGNDTLMGFGGSDILLGGNGNDTLSGDCAAQEGHYSATMDGNDSLDGGAGDDTLYGDGKDDLLIGGDGNDKLHGDNSTNNLEGQYHGKDQLFGGAGNDSLWGGGNDDQLEGGAGDDYLEGDASDLAGQFHGKDTLVGGDGNDTLFGDGGDDVLSGGSGDDYLNGDNEALEAIYQGNDTLDGGDGNDTLYGGGGNDRLTGGAGDDYMVGDDKALSADATFTGDDVLSGGAGHDYLAGGKGNDVLNGGADLDNLLGGDGDDTYIFNTGDSVPIVNGNVLTVEWIDDDSGNNTIAFGSAINQSDIKITHSLNSNDLNVW
nr:calcium-binding protein [uncultured Tolumonas sp.]